MHNKSLFLPNHVFYVFKRYIGGNRFIKYAPNRTLLSDAPACMSIPYAHSPK